MRILLFIWLVGMSFSVNAQYGGYWGESFNTRAALLSGAVVGGYEDESSIYYNPGILSDSGKTKLTFATGLFTFDFVRYENALGDDFDVSNYQTRVAPNFVSLHIYPEHMDGLVFQVAVFTKSKIDQSLSEIIRSSTNVLEQYPGAENYMGRINTRIEYQDTWVGFGVAKFLNKSISVGMSVFGHYKGLKYGYEISNIATPNPVMYPNGRTAQSYEIISADGYDWRGTVKMGVNVKLNKKIGVGMNLTFPSFSVYSNGESVKNIHVSNIYDTQSNSYFLDNVIDEHASEVKFNLKDPFSASFGIDYKLKKYRMNFVVEYFAGIQPYKSIDQTTGNIQTTTSANAGVPKEFVSFVDGGKGIANFALGLEYKSSAKRSWLFGFKTNFDPHKNFDYGVYNDLNTVHYVASDYYYGSVGTNFSFLNFDILFGLQYALSRQRNNLQFVNFSEPVQYNPAGPYVLRGVPKENMRFYGDQIAIFVSVTLKQ